MLDCSGDSDWNTFRGALAATVHSGKLVLNEHMVEAASAIINSIPSQGLLGGAEAFYKDLCDDAASSFCLYGVVNAMFVLAAHTHGSDRQKYAAMAQDQLRTAVSLLGFQWCLDFMESTKWPIRANDIIANLNRTEETVFRLAAQVGEAPPAMAPPTGSSLLAWPAESLAASLTSALRCESTVNVVAVGTHPTLTLEAITMFRDVAFAGRPVQLQRTLGIAYKCPVFPEMCGTSTGQYDPIAELIGPFEAPPPYDSYTFERISQTLEAVGILLTSGAFDALLCTSPFVVCGLLQKWTQVPMLGFLGLPMVWKRPTDHFDNATAHAEFWRLLSGLVANPRVVLVTNNPLLSEQIAFQSPSVRLPVIRPHARFTGAAYVPTRFREALLFSRTKFLWVTASCAIRHYTPNAYPISFTIANTDSKLSFNEIASFRIAVMLPWEHALMAFFELYSMAVPILMPDAAWSYRLVFDNEGNLGSTTSEYWDVSPDCDRSRGCVGSHHAYPPFAFASLESRRYWYPYSSFAQFPHVHRFASFPDMLGKLLDINVAETSASMKVFNDRTFVHSAAFWREAAVRMLKGHTACERPVA